MITFRWRNVAELDLTRKYVGLLGLVRLSSPLLLPTFIQFGFRIERQLKRTPGLMGYRTAAEPFSLTFYHLSAWLDGEAIHNFVHTDPHLRAMQKLTGRLGETTFRYWEVDGSDLPLQTERELHRLRT